MPAWRPARVADACLLAAIFAAIGPGVAFPKNRLRVLFAHVEGVVLGEFGYFHVSSLAYWFMYGPVAGSTVIGALTLGIVFAFGRQIDAPGAFRLKCRPVLITEELQSRVPGV